MLTGILLTVAGLAGVTYGALTGSRSKKRENAQDTLESIVKNDPILKEYSVQDLINQAANLGYITTDDKTKYLKLLKEFDNDHGPFEAALDFSGKTSEEIARLYGVLTQVAPEISQAMDDYAGVDVKGAIMSNIPSIANAPSPGYFDADFYTGTEDLEAGPLKWWGGKELAEHHDLHWDLDEMYNAVKEGTTARLAAQQYNSAQQNNASMYNELNDQVQYLSDLRNTKSDAITSGATAGQRAANEVLGLINKGSEFSQNQAQVASNRWDTVQQALLNDAQAEVTANNNYMNLGRNIFGNIEYLYGNDVDRRGAELENYANLYAADQALRGAYQEANANMFAQQAQANAEINAARASIGDATNRYAWMWDRFFGRAQEQGFTGKTANAIANRDFFNWAMSESTGTQNYVNFRSKQDANY